MPLSVLSRKRIVIIAASSAIALVLLALLIATSGGSNPTQRTARADATAPAPLAGSLRRHPRVVLAYGPGQAPPGAAEATPPAPTPNQPAGGGQHTKYGSTTEASDFRPPSDAQIRAELHAFKVAGLGPTGSYVNPFAHVASLTPERIDMGVDYSGTGPVVALGSGTVFNTNGAGWPGGVFVGIALDRGPYAGRRYYVAEDVIPTVRVGQHVEAGQVIATMYNGGSGIETGWASGRADEPLAAALSQQSPADPGGWTSAAGLSFDRLLVSAGAPSGIPQGGGVHGRMPAGYP